MATRADIIRETEEWLGTPYRHQRSDKNVGCDCLGLLRGVWRATYQAPEPEQAPPYTPSWGDHRPDDPLLQIAKKYFDEVSLGVMIPSDVIMFRMRRFVAVKHCAIYVGNNEMIHAYSNHHVMRGEITDSWKRRVAGVFRWRL